jgi:hypothetical protein
VEDVVRDKDQGVDWGQITGVFICQMKEQKDIEQLYVGSGAIPGEKPMLEEFQDGG